MDMSTDTGGIYPIDAADLQPVIDLLLIEAIPKSDANAVSEIITELEQLPHPCTGAFSVTFLNRYTSENGEVGSGSEWVALDAGDEGLSFTAGSHIHYPDIGGDSSTDVLFECTLCHSASGDLHDWLRSLASLDLATMQINAVHERDEVDLTYRDKLTLACEKAARDVRLSPEMRDEAERAYKNLMAIRAIKQQ